MARAALETILEGWVRRAVTVANADELFASPARRTSPRWFPPSITPTSWFLLIDGKPVLGIVVERWSWPVYVASLRAKLDCPACVLVVTPSRRRRVP
jgi:hypothetical protein